MLKKLILILLALSVTFAGANAQKQSPRLFKKGETLVTIGDSITHAGFHTVNILLFYATRYPDAPFAIRNAGMSGENAHRMFKRMEYDILSTNPNLAIMMIGMNDSPRSFFSKINPPKQDVKVVANRNRKYYEMWVDKSLARLTEKNVRTIVFTPSIFDQTLINDKVDPYIGCNDDLGKMGDICTRLAKKHNSHLVDIWGYMTDTNALYQKEDPKRSFINTSDRVHPQNLGGFVIMAKLVSDFDESRLVSLLNINAKDKNTFAYNAGISDLKISPTEVSFSALENALPFPTTDEMDEADRVLAFLDKYNKQILIVDNLPKGEWELSIDGEKIGKFTNRQLRYNGINLAKFKNTPQYKQAQEVARLARAYGSAAAATRTKIFEVEFWRNLVDLKTNEEKFKRLEEIINSGKITKPWALRAAKEYPANKLKQAEMLASEQEIIAKTYAAAQPRVHKFKLELVK